MKYYLLIILNYLQQLVSHSYYKISIKKDITELRNTNFDNIYINRNDRIGDAIVTLPVLLGLPEHIKSRVTVITSKNNDWIIKPFLKTKIESFEDSYDNNIIKSLINLVKNILSFKKRLKKSNNLFIDIKGDHKLSELYSNCKILSFKSLSLNINHSDFIYDDFFVYGSKNNMQIKLKTLFDDIFNCDIDLYSQYNKLSNHCISVHDKDIEKYKDDKNIIVYIGNKLNRNLSKNNWTLLIRYISLFGKVLVIDDPEQKMINQLSNIDILKSNKITFMKQSYDLWSLMYLTSNSRMFIGIDGGGYHFMQTLTKSFQIQATCHSPTWDSLAIINKKYKYSINNENLKWYYEYLQLNDCLNKHGDMFELKKRLSKCLRD